MGSNSRLYALEYTRTHNLKILREARQFISGYIKLTRVQAFLLSLLNLDSRVLIASFFCSYMSNSLNCPETNLNIIWSVKLSPLI